MFLRGTPHSVFVTERSRERGERVRRREREKGRKEGRSSLAYILILKQQGRETERRPTKEGRW